MRKFIVFQLSKLESLFQLLEIPQLIRLTAQFETMSDFVFKSNRHLNSRQANDKQIINCFPDQTKVFLKPIISLCSRSFFQSKPFQKSSTRRLVNGQLI